MSGTDWRDAEIARLREEIATAMRRAYRVGYRIGHGAGGHDSLEWDDRTDAEVDELLAGERAKAEAEGT